MDEREDARLSVALPDLPFLGHGCKRHASVGIHPKLQPISGADGQGSSCCSSSQRSCNGAAKQKVECKHDPDDEDDEMHVYRKIFVFTRIAADSVFSLGFPENRRSVFLIFNFLKHLVSRDSPCAGHHFHSHKQLTKTMAASSSSSSKPRIIIANRIYSSWSLRPWVLLRARGIDFDETFVPFHEPNFNAVVIAAAGGSGSGKVPALVHNGNVVWESLSILEYLHEQFPDRGVWPSDVAARAHARSISSEMHAGFTALRMACPMNLGRRYAERDRGEDVAKNVQRICFLWKEARERFGKKATGAQAGPFLYGAFSAADAMYTPVVTRLDTYSITVEPEIREYMDAVLKHPAYVAWLDAALKEPWIDVKDESGEPAIANLRDPATLQALPKSF